VIEREWEVNESLLSPALLARVVLLDNVVDLRDGRRNQQRHDERKDEPVPAGEKDENAVEDTEDGESPANRVDNDLLTTGGELVDHGTKEQKVDQGPNVKGLVLDSTDSD